MSDIWRIYDIHIINTIDREDRYHHIIHELNRVGITRYKIWRFQNHKKDFVKRALYDNIQTIFKECIFDKPILILEDDSIFIDSNTYLLYDIKLFIDYSDCHDWDTIRLGYTKPIYIDKVQFNLFRGNCSYTTGVIYSPVFAKQLFHYLSYIDDYEYHIGNTIYNDNKNDKQYLLYDWFLAKISGRCILPVDTILIQGYHGSDNEWNIKYMNELIQDPMKYHTKYNSIGMIYSFPSYKNIIYYVPSFIRYYIIMMKYHNIWDIIRGKITYELRNVNKLYINANTVRLLKLPCNLNQQL